MPTVKQALNFVKADWDALCRLNGANPLPGVFTNWDWLNYQIDCAADCAQDEARLATYKAFRQLHSTMNKAQLDIVRNSGRQLAWRTSSNLL